MPLLLDKNVRELRDGDRKVSVPVDALGRQRFTAKLTGSVVRTANADGSIPFRGHSSVFNTMTRIGGKYGFWEEIAPTAFTKTIREADVRLLINHDPNLVLARNVSGTLRHSIDDVGLLCEADMAPTTYARDLAILLERGDVSQMSFAFDPIDYTIREADDGSAIYRVTEAKLYDDSIVTYPAYDTTDAGLRGAAFDALCRSRGLDPYTTLEELFVTKRSDEYGSTDDGDEAHEDVVACCVNCETENDPDAKFCKACGAAMGAAGSAVQDAGVAQGDGEDRDAHHSADVMSLSVARARLELSARR